MIARTIELLPFVEYNIHIREAKGNVPDLSNVEVFSADHFPKGMQENFQFLWVDPHESTARLLLLDFPSFTNGGFVDPVAKFKFSEFICRFDLGFESDKKITIEVSRDSDLDFEVYAVPSCVKYS